MSSDGSEEDYMSEAFLKSLEESDVKPGLTFNRATKRKHELEKKKEVLNPKKRIESESEARTSGLEKPIDDKNKGFKLLQKMGFKVEEGMKKPIGIEIKTGRSGLGMESATMQKLLDIESVRLKQFKQKTSMSTNERWVLNDLKSSQRSCFDLDSKAQIEVPVKEHFWPRNVVRGLKEKDGEESNLLECEEDEDMTDSAKKLDEVTTYLRHSHMYCLWCGIKFDSSEDMDLNCPGSNRESHVDLL